MKIDTIGSGNIGSEVRTQVRSETAIRRAAEHDFLHLFAANACASLNEQARERSLDTLPFCAATMVTDSPFVCGVLVRGGR